MKINKHLKPEVKLTDEHGNVFSIIARVRRALIKAGADQEYVNQYTQACMTAEDYDKVLQITMDYVEVI